MVVESEMVVIFLGSRDNKGQLQLQFLQLDSLISLQEKD